MVSKAVHSDSAMIWHSVDSTNPTLNFILFEKNQKTNAILTCGFSHQKLGIGIDCLIQLPVANHKDCCLGVT